MRMKKIVENRTLKGAATEFIAFKRAQKIRERTLHDYEKYINPFIEQSSNSMDVDVLKKEILEYFANIPTTSPARYNHPYQYLHALFAWCAKQDYLPYNPFDKLELKKLKDEGNIKPATIEDIQSFLKCLDKHNNCELRDYNITMVMVDRFGTSSDVFYRPDGDRHFVVTTEIAISDQFYGWLCGFRKMAKIVSPPDVVSDFQKFLDDIYGRYEVD